MADFKNKMEKVRDCFTAHPHSIQETYPEHLRYAGLSGIRLVIAGFACIIHSVCPFWFENTASNTIRSLHDEMNERKSKRENENKPS